VPEIVIPVKLEDLISYPARKAAEAMSGAVKQATTLERSLKSLEAQAVRAQALGDTAKVAKLGGMTEKIEQSLKSVSMEAKLAEFAGAALEAGAVGVVALADATLHAAETALEVSGAYNKAKASFEAMGAAAGITGQEVLTMVADVSREVPNSEQQLRGWTQQLMAAGLVDMGGLRDTLTAAAGAETLVAGGAEKLLGLVTHLQEAALAGTKIKFSTRMLAGTGVTEEEFMQALGMTPRNFQAAVKAGTITGTKISDALTAVLKEKTKGSLAATMGEMGSIVTKGTDAIKRLFEGINVEPLTEGIRDFFDVFDQGKSSGAALHDILQDTLGVVFKGAGDATHAFTRMFLYAELYTLKAVNAFGELRKSLTDVPWAAIASGLAVVFAPAIIAGVVGLGTAIAGATAAISAFMVAAAPFIAAGAAVGLAIDQASKLAKEMKGVTLHDLGNPFRSSAALSHTLSTDTAGTGITSWGAGALPMKPHATGGEVTAPAPGEYVASVKPGEHIVPAGKTIEGMGGGGSNVDVGGVHVHVYATPGAPADVQAREIGHEVAEQLALLFGQLRLTQGV